METLLECRHTHTQNIWLPKYWQSELSRRDSKLWPTQFPFSLISQLLILVSPQFLPKSWNCFPTSPWIFVLPLEYYSLWYICSKLLITWIFKIKSYCTLFKQKRGEKIKRYKNPWFYPTISWLLILSKNLNSSLIRACSMKE